jgi:hypothetical protein
MRVSVGTFAIWPSYYPEYCPGGWPSKKKRELHMSTSPMLFVHIGAGTLGLLAGASAMVFRKGSQRHRLSGNVFVIGMLTLAVSGVLLALLKHKMGDVVGGTLTFYLVFTAWLTARHKDGKPGILDWGALVIALGLVAVTLAWGIAAANSPTGTKNGYPVWTYAFLGIVPLLAATGDVRMMVRGGIAGSQRLARHLWRMCYALFIASASVFLARPHLFPAFFRSSGLLIALTVLPLLLMLFWLVRVRYANGTGASPKLTPMQSATGVAQGYQDIRG